MAKINALRNERTRALTALFSLQPFYETLSIQFYVLKISMANYKYIDHAFTAPEKVFFFLKLYDIFSKVMVRIWRHNNIH